MTPQPRPSDPWRRRAPSRLTGPPVGRVALPGLVALATLGGCREPSVGVRVVFPSERAFLHTAVARVDVYDGSEGGDRSPDAICRALSQNPPTPPDGVRLLAASGNKGACLLQDGGVNLAGIGVGRRVVFVEGIDEDGRAILRGCTVVDLFGDDQPLSGNDDATARDLGVNALVDVQLAFLPDFPAGDAGCASVTEKCEEAVSCRP